MPYLSLWNAKNDFEEIYRLKKYLAWQGTFCLGTTLFTCICTCKIKINKLYSVSIICMFSNIHTHIHFISTLLDYRRFVYAAALDAHYMFPSPVRNQFLVPLQGQVSSGFCSFLFITCFNMSHCKIQFVWLKITYS